MNLYPLALGFYCAHPAGVAARFERHHRHLHHDHHVDSDRDGTGRLVGHFAVTTGNVRTDYDF